jgi:hypothetical protein
MLAAVQAVEVGDTVDAEQHRFAVQDEGAGPVTQRGFDDAWVSTAPVVAVAGARLEALVRDRNVPQKQVWRAEIVLLSADGLGINDHAPDRQVQDLRLALAGTLHARGL